MTFCAAHCERWLYLPGILGSLRSMWKATTPVGKSIIAFSLTWNVWRKPCTKTRKTFFTRYAKRNNNCRSKIKHSDSFFIIRRFLKHFILNKKSNNCNSEQKVVETIVNIMPTDIVNAGPKGLDCSIAHMYCVYNVVFNYHLACVLPWSCALATSTGYAGKRPLPWLACNVARA